MLAVVDRERDHRFDVGGTGETPASAEWSTAVVDQDEAFVYWRDMICEAFVRLAARPVAAASETP